MAETKTKKETEEEAATVTAHLRDKADSTVDSVKRLVAAQGAYVKSASGDKIEVEFPPESDRNPDSQRQRVTAALLNDPLVVEVE